MTRKGGAAPTNMLRRVVLHVGMSAGALRRLRMWGGAARFFVRWFGMFAAMGSFSTCPCCGQQGCGVGMAGAGLMGGIASGIIACLRQIAGFSKRRSHLEHQHGWHGLQTEEG